MRFKTFLYEGGNNTINGAEAQPIPISGENSISRGEFRKLVIDAIRDMNSKFQKEYNEPLYKDFSVVEKGKVFAGSTAAFIDNSISDDAYSEKKPQIGDIDLQVNKMYSTALKEFLTKYTDKKFGELTFKGFKDAGLQLITVLGFPAKYKNIPKYFQMDLELVEFKGTAPTDISLFMRSSSWEDIQNNIKGSLHKFLIQAMTVTEERFLVISKVGLKKVAEGEKLEAKHFKKKEGNKVMTLGPEGMREKYKLVLDPKGNPISFNGKRVFKELTTAESKMITSMNSIFELVTKEKATRASVKDFGSFVGVIRLLKKYKLPSKRIKDIITNYSISMWGSKNKFGNTKEKDLLVKSAGWEVIKKSFPKEWAAAEKEIAPKRENFYKSF